MAGMPRASSYQHWNRLLHCESRLWQVYCATIAGFCGRTFCFFKYLLGILFAVIFHIFSPLYIVVNVSGQFLRINPSAIFEYQA